MRIRIITSFITACFASLFLLSCGEILDISTVPTESVITNSKTAATTSTIQTKSSPVPTTPAQAAPRASKVLIDVPSIAGKSQAQIETVLGAPISTSTANPSGTPCPCPKITYSKGSTEVIFMNGKADWITINQTGDLNYSKDSLAQLGLPVTNPSFSSSETMRWENIGGINEISFFPSGSGIFYIEAKVATT